jgi:hypothetical protein
MQKGRKRKSNKGGQKVTKERNKERKKGRKKEKEKERKLQWMKDRMDDLFYKRFIVISLVYKNSETDAFLRDKRKSIFRKVRF